MDRSGSYTFGYERTGLGTAETDTLTANVEPWDHDGDDCTAADITDPDNTACTTDAGSTVPLVSTDGTGTVQWASAADGVQAFDEAKQILRIDTATNTIFVGTVTGTAPDYTVTPGSVEVIYYDSNDRFNIARTAAADDGDAAVPAGAAGYAQFERNLFNLAGFELSWDIVGTGSRDVNEFTLTTPHADDIDPVIYW